MNRALTVKQPWANAIIFDGKDVENRSKPTKYRGQLYIHAGKGWESSAVGFIAKITRKAYIAADQGMVIGTVDVVGCHSWRDCGPGEGMCSAWAMEGHYHWELANPRPLACPFPEKGKLGIWNLGQLETDAYGTEASL
jgi:ASCH domain